MKKRNYIKDILVAIKSVKSRAKTANEMGDAQEAEKLVGDLIALEVCLVIESEKSEAEDEEEAA